MAKRNEICMPMIQAGTAATLDPEDFALPPRLIQAVARLAGEHGAHAVVRACARAAVHGDIVACFGQKVTGVLADEVFEPRQLRRSEIDKLRAKGFTVTNNDAHWVPAGNGRARMRMDRAMGWGVRKELEAYQGIQFSV